MNVKLNFVSGRVENIVGKGENAGYQHFLLFTKMFSKGILHGVVKSRDCVVKSMQHDFPSFINLVLGYVYYSSNINLYICSDVFNAFM